MRNYEFVTGIVGKFTEGMLHHQEISMVDNILLRTLGHYGNILDAYEKDLRSPFKWLRYGIRVVVGLPVSILNWFGIISDTRLDSILSNRLFGLISGVIALLSFAGTIVTLVTGWPAFRNIISSYFNIFR